MELNNLLNLKTRDELRDWFTKNYNKEKECWINVKRGRPKDDGTFWYIDAVEEALCFGWIDSTTKKISDTITVQRLSPRSKTSQWTELNKERVRRMEAIGKMTDAGRRVLPDMSLHGFVVDNDILKELQKEENVWNNYTTLPELYTRIRIDTIQVNKKKYPDLFQSRLQKFIDNTRQNTMYGEWNDNGRLLKLKEV
jgi:uncharacterized protein YdeI (YjbR/CyaY-like superfamily)